MVQKKNGELDEVTSEVRKLNISLKELGDKKESKYKEKNELEETLNKLIIKANQLKEKKDNVDKRTKELKRLREEKNKSVQNLIGELNKVKKTLSGTKKKIERRNKVKKEINNLEFLVQTEVLNFSKEKEHMSKINKLKKDLKEINNSLGELHELRKIRGLITNAKQSADEYHGKIQGSAKESTDIFNQLTIISKEISNIKKERSNTRAALRSMKSQINQLNILLAKNLSRLGRLPMATGRVMFGGAKAGAEILQKQTEAVRDKFKKKKKLSKEDIFILQKEAIKKEKKSKK